jgi:hypothetical protein
MVGFMLGPLYTAKMGGFIGGEKKLVQGVPGFNARQAGCSAGLARRDAGNNPACSAISQNQNGANRSWLR